MVRDDHGKRVSGCSRWRPTGRDGECRAQNLETAHPKQLHAHFPKPRRLEFQPDQEKQKNDADLPDLDHRVSGANQLQDVRPDQRSGDEIAERGTQPEPAEHLIAVIFTQPDFIEVAFARFKLLDGKGCSLVYSHRIYGKEIGDEMRAWLTANGEAIETTLMEWSSIPSPALLRQEPL